MTTARRLRPAPSFTSLAVAAALLELSFVSPCHARAEPPSSTTSPETQDDAVTTGDSAAEAPSTEPPAQPTPPAQPVPPAPASTRARVVWAEGSSANDERKRAPIPAEDPNPPSDGTPPKPWMLSLTLNAESLGGDFDDSTVVVRQVDGYAPDFTLLPRLGAGFGFSLGLSYGALPRRLGASGVWSGVSYSAAWFAASSANTPATPHASLHSIEVPLRFTYRAWRRAVPYLHASYGLGFALLEGVHGGFADGMPAFDDRSVLLFGQVISLGVGSFFTLTDHLSIDVSVAYRVLVGTNLDGSGFDGDLVGHGLVLRVGPTVSL